MNEDRQLTLRDTVGQSFDRYNSQRPPQRVRNQPASTSNDLNAHFTARDAVVPSASPSES